MERKQTMKLALALALLAFGEEKCVLAQQPGTQQKEVSPAFSYSTCTKESGCSEVTSSLVIGMYQVPSVVCFLFLFLLPDSLCFIYILYPTQRASSQTRTGAGRTWTARTATRETSGTRHTAPETTRRVHRHAPRNAVWRALIRNTTIRTG